MVSSSPMKILVAIPSNLEESKELLSWAITVLAHQNDCIVASHILVSEEDTIKKHGSKTTKIQSQLRRAKANVISILGEFSKISQSKQVNLEARVGFNSSIGRGLVQEAQSISADFLVLRTTKNRSKNKNLSISRFCFEHAPEKCTLVYLGKQPPQLHMNLNSDSVPPFTEVYSERRKNDSPPNSTEDDSSSSGDSSIMESPPAPLVSHLKGQSNDRRQRLSPCKLISTFLGSPFRKRNCSFSNQETSHPLLRCFSYEEIMIATNNFHPDNMAGQGGYSEVYRGELSDGKSIAVKRLTKCNKDANKEKEFLMELGIIGHVSHPNTASLVGCCIENGLYLIFNFSENGNLSSALHGKAGKALEWNVRYKIAVGIARGLHYLHKCCKHRIIHRDIKASNVLLGPDYEPQITDFGLAKWLPNKWTHHAVIPIEGTFGYLAPEYFMHGLVDEKTDVFAFGVLLLEIVTGRRPVDSSKQSLLLWAKPLMEREEMGKLADPRMNGIYDEEELERLVCAASYCVRQSSVWRPSMSEVLELLTKGCDSEMAKSWTIQNFNSSESEYDDDHQLNDYSMLFGYQVPIHNPLHHYL